MAEAAIYPGTGASAEEVLALATEYDKAAQILETTARKGKPLSRAPCRLCAIHAIELYLNAFLLHLGETPEQIRARQHDLTERTRLALDAGLKLRNKTAEHLDWMSSNREYLATRYDAELASPLSNPTRLLATLKEVATKVKGAVLPPEAP